MNELQEWTEEEKRVFDDDGDLPNFVGLTGDEIGLWQKLGTFVSKNTLPFGLNNFVAPVRVQVNSEHVDAFIGRMLQVGVLEQCEDGRFDIPGNAA